MLRIKLIKFPALITPGIDLFILDMLGAIYLMSNMINFGKTRNKINLDRYSKSSSISKELKIFT